MKVIKIVGAVFGLLLAALVVVLAIGIPGGFVTTFIENQVERETGYQLDINGGATVKLWPLTVVTLNNVAVHDPKDRTTSERLRAESITAEVSLRSLFTGNPRIREVNIEKPVINLPMERVRTQPAQTTSRSDKAIDDIPMLVDRVVVSDAVLVFKDTRNQIESRVEQVNIKATTSKDRKLDVTADGKAGTHTIKLEAKTTVPTGTVDNLTLPVDFKFEALSILPQAVSGTGEVKVKGATITINSLTGTLGTAQFSGYASVEATAKPLVKVNLDFKQLDIDTPAAISTKPVTRSIQPQGWSETIIDLDGLNYVDAELQVSAAQLNIGAVRFAPAKIEGTLTSGIVRMTLSELGMYDGKAAAGFAVDASIPSPIYALRADLRGVRALPLLNALGDFTSLDGKMQSQIDVRTTGRTQRELLSNLSGTTTADFQDGQIRGINLAQMIRSLTASTLQGWQEDGAKTTDLTELRASFKIEKGIAETSDIKLAGPLVRLAGTGSADLNAKTLSLRLEPKLVMTTQGQGSTVENPIGLGVPVVVEGPWRAPRIYPDMAGILDNPDAAFAKLREMGQGLFGSDLFGKKDAGPGGQSGQSGGNKLIENLGTIIQGLGSQGSGNQGSGNQGSGDQGNAQSGAGQGAAQGSAQSTSPAPQQSQQKDQIDSIIKQLFGR